MKNDTFWTAVALAVTAVMIGLVIYAYISGLHGPTPPRMRLQ